MTFEKSNSSREEIHKEINMFNHIQDEFSSLESNNPLNINLPTNDDPDAQAVDISKRSVYLQLHQRERDHQRHIKGLRSVFNRLTKKLMD